MREFVEMVKTEAAKHGVKVTVSDQDHVLWGQIKCNGYFRELPAPELVFCTGQPEDQWLRVLIHEYCHMRQWIDQCAAWTALWVRETVDTTDLIDLWLDYVIEAPQERLKQWVQLSLDNELDCEQRAARLIKKQGLPLYIPDYIRRANAYVMFYHVMRKYRRWYDIGKEPYNVEEVWSQMPENFGELDYTQLSAEHERLYLRHLFGAK